MTSEQVADFVFEHRHTVREFDFENVALINDGTWEDALAPLTKISGSDAWLSQQSGSEDESYRSCQSNADLEQLQGLEEVIDTPADARRTSVLVTKLKKKRLRRRHRRKQKETATAPVRSNPIPVSEPVIELLQPTTFDPNVQGVQRNVQQEEAQQYLADDPDKRISTLRKAKEAVLTKLGKEFCRNLERKEHVKGFFKNSCSAGRKGRAFMGHESNTALVPLMFSRY
jgi:hypothetical protein